MNSKHWTQDRKRRAEVITMIGEGVEIKRTVLDRGHKNGAEIHVISSTGIITVYNQRTGRMITKMIARPGQIKRYYKENETIPAGLIEIAREHLKANLNHQDSKESFFYVRKKSLPYTIIVVNNSCAPKNFTTVSRSLSRGKNEKIEKNIFFLKCGRPVDNL